MRADTPLLRGGAWPCDDPAGRGGDGTRKEPAVCGGDWLREEPAVCGVARLRAGLLKHAYSRHRHDTYTIALTESGVQQFDYRGSAHRSLPGQVVVLHPDEAHDGRPGTRDGFSYRTLYLDPARVLDATRALAGRGATGSTCTLPFVESPVLSDPALAGVVAGAFDGPLEPLRVDELVLAVSAALLRVARPRPAAARRSRRRALGDAVMSRAREFLDANFARAIDAAELEAVCAETRYAISAQFRRRYGTSPYRYVLLRRLDYVRARLGTGPRLADLALDAGFADQAHMSRMFKAAYGLTPGACGRLRAPLEFTAA